MALQPFVGPWHAPQFRNLFYTGDNFASLLDSEQVVGKKMYLLTAVSKSY
jgi:hypothetical protein